MMQELLIKTNKHQEIVIISDEINDIIKSSKITQGICNIYSTNTTATLIVNEVSEPNLKEDNEIVHVLKENKLLLGKWQDIALVELDGPRERKLIVSLIKV